MSSQKWYRCKNLRFLSTRQVSDIFRTEFMPCLKLIIYSPDFSNLPKFMTLVHVFFNTETSKIQNQNAEKKNNVSPLQDSRAWLGLTEAITNKLTGTPLCLNNLRHLTYGKQWIYKSYHIVDLHCFIRKEKLSSRINTCSRRIAGV